MKTKYLVLSLSAILLSQMSYATDSNQNENYFSRAALVDTGYDACQLSGGNACENNKNLLFRGEQPLEDNTFRYDPDLFREVIFDYLQTFKQVYATKASLPQSLDELKQYRIVIVNLLYDAHDNGSDAEYGELTHEFLYSGAVSTPQIPEQHKIYGLDLAFNPNQFAFEWWPVAFTEQNNPKDITLNLNWPDKDIVSVPRSDQVYKKLDFPYLVTGIPFGSNQEDQAMDLHTLLKYIPDDGHPLLIFYHCVAGKDRTGATTLGYLMKHGGYANVSPQNKLMIYQHRNPPLSFSSALQAVTQYNYPRPREGALVLAQAYCYSLGKATNECELNQTRKH